MINVDKTPSRRRRCRRHGGNDNNVLGVNVKQCMPCDVTSPRLWRRLVLMPAPPGDVVRYQPTTVTMPVWRQTGV